MPELKTLYDYLRVNARELGRRILESYPPLHGLDDEPAPELSHLLREPLPAQTLAIMGTVKYLRAHDAAKIVGECGTGKTFMGAAITYILGHRRGASTTLVMCPPHLTKKWAREMLITIPGAHTYLIEDMRNGGDKNKPHGVCEVQLKGGKTVHHGLHTTLPKLREMGSKAWKKAHPGNCYFIVGREKGKLGYFWKHVYKEASAANHMKEHWGSVINIDSMLPVPKTTNGILTQDDFDDKRKHQQVLDRDRNGTSIFSPMWSADRSKIVRMAPLDFMGRYMKDWFDFSIADEVHQLAGDTAQGNGLAVLARAAKKVITLTGTMMGGYADDLFQIFYRIDGPSMAREGFESSGAGRELFQRKYGVIETVEKIEENNNACSKNQKKKVQILRRPGCSPMLFGNHLMDSTAFISLEDISDALPPYREEVLEIDAGKTLGSAYKELEEQIKQTIKQYPKDKGLRAIMLQTLLCYPDHAFGWDTIYRRMWDKKAREFLTIRVADPPNLKTSTLSPKEVELIADIKRELAEGRKCQVFAVYTGKRDVVGRLESVLRDAGLRVAVLRPSVATDRREDWYVKQLKQGVDVVVCHPKLVETGLDLLYFPTIYFYESGYSTYTLRQASRRSWRIGQSKDVRVKFFSYKDTMQSKCIRLMGKKVLVSMMMEGKFSGEGLAGIEEDTDLMSAMARELVEEGGVGESANDVWRQVNQQRTKLFGEARANEEPVALPANETPEAVPEVAVEVAVSVDPIPTPEIMIIPPAPTSIVSIYSFLPEVVSLKRKKASRSLEDSGQLSLFLAA